MKQQGMTFSYFFYAFIELCSNASLLFFNAGGTGVLAFDPKHRHWWVQDHTFEPGKDQGFAWLEDPSYCPELGFSPQRFNCEISGR